MAGGQVKETLVIAPHLVTSTAALTSPTHQHGMLYSVIKNFFAVPVPTFNDYGRIVLINLSNQLLYH